MSNKNFEVVLNEFFVKLRDRDNEYMATKFSNLPLNDWDLTFGKRFVKIVRDRSVYAFVEIGSGDIYMPASWSAPAKHVRGNIFSDDPLACTGIYGVNYLR